MSVVILVIILGAIVVSVFVFLLPKADSVYWAGIGGVFVGAVVGWIGNLINNIFQTREKQRDRKGQFERDAASAALEILKYAREQKNEIHKVKREYVELFNQLSELFTDERKKQQNDP